MAKKFLSTLTLLILAALPAAAQQWTIGVGAGPFVFGKFATRTLRAGNEQPGGPVTRLKLSAATRPGGAVDLQRDFNDRFALRLQTTFTRAPLQVQPESGGGVSLGAGHVDVTTIGLPLLINLNPHGRLRVHIKGGPAYAVYHIERESPISASPFVGTRSRFGAMAGAGLIWWWSSRFAVEGEVLDIVTSSPLRKSDFIGPASVSIPRSQNEHATIGVRVRL